MPPTHPKPATIREAVADALAERNLTDSELSRVSLRVAGALAPDYEQTGEIFNQALAAMGERERLAYWLWSLLKNISQEEPTGPNSLGAMSALSTLGYGAGRLNDLAMRGEPVPSMREM